jgi:hypothetical protein
MSQRVNEAHAGEKKGRRRDTGARISWLTAALVASGTLPSLTEAFGKGGAASDQYRPGWGCGDRNHIHTGPPGRQYATPPPGCLKAP